MNESVHLDSGLPPSIVREIIAAMGNPSLFDLLKDDTSTTVGIIRGEHIGIDGDILVKRFNRAGVFRWLLQLFAGSRAQRLWTINRALHERGLPVPRPLAYTSAFMKTGASLFISSVISNTENLVDIYRRGRFSESSGIGKDLGETVSSWHMKGAVHGDLKWSNILGRNEGGAYRFFFIDLDQSRLHPEPRVQGVERDLIRFYRYGLELGADEWVANTFFPAYMAGLSPQIRESVDVAAIRRRSIREWENKGRRKLT